MVPEMSESVAAAGVVDDRVDQLHRPAVEDAAALGGAARGGVGRQGVVDQRRATQVEEAAAGGGAGRGRDAVAEQGGVGHREGALLHGDGIAPDAAALGVAGVRAGAVVGDGAGGDRQIAKAHNAAALGTAAVGGGVVAGHRAVDQGREALDVDAAALGLAGAGVAGGVAGDGQAGEGTLVSGPDAAAQGGAAPTAGGGVAAHRAAGPVHGGIEGAGGAGRVADDVDVGERPKLAQEVEAAALREPGAAVGGGVAAEGQVGQRRDGVADVEVAAARGAAPGRGRGGVVGEDGVDDRAGRAEIDDAAALGLAGLGGGLVAGDGAAADRQGRAEARDAAPPGEAAAGSAVAGDKAVDQRQRAEAADAAALGGVGGGSGVAGDKAVDQRQRTVAAAEDAAALDEFAGGGAVGDDIVEKRQVALVVDGAAAEEAGVGSKAAVCNRQPGDGGADALVNKEDLVGVAAADADDIRPGALDVDVVGHGQHGRQRDGAAETGGEHDGVVGAERLGLIDLAQLLRRQAGGTAGVDRLQRLAQGQDAVRRDVVEQAVDRQHGRDRAILQPLQPRLEPGRGRAGGAGEQVADPGTSGHRNLHPEGDRLQRNGKSTQRAGREGDQAM